MKKLIIILVAGFALYQINNRFFSGNANKGAFDSDGKPLVWVFTFNGCSKACDSLVELLDKRADYTIYDISDETGKQLFQSMGGSRVFPLIVIGRQKIFGYTPMKIRSALAEELGPQTLTRRERGIMNGHFYTDDSPAIVMYTSSECKACEKMREYFADNNIDYIDRDADGEAKAAFEGLHGCPLPLIYVGYRYIDGANTMAMEQAIEQAMADYQM